MTSWKQLRRALSGRGERDQVPARRTPHLPAAILGNGSLLATLSARGEVERLFWPHVDWGQHLGELRIGLAETGGGNRWLDEDGFTHEQHYLPDTSVLVTTARSPMEAVELTDLVCPDEPVFLRRIRTVPAAERARLVVYIRPELDESARYGSGYVDPGSGALLFYRRDRALAIGFAGGEACVGRIRPTEASALFAAAAAGRPHGEPIDCGTVDGALAVDLHEGEALLAFAFAETPQAALALVRRSLDGFECALERRRRADAERLATAPEPTVVGDGVVPLYRRSLLTFHLVSDRLSGAVIAAPEMDRELARSGGYGFAWTRDVAFTVLAFLAAEQADLARRALLWLARSQAPEGTWLHRHWTSGDLAPSWGLHQVDETGSALFAFQAAWSALADETLDTELWPAAKRAAEFLIAFCDPHTGLPSSSVDLWEERTGTHAYSAAAVAAGLAAAAAIAARHEPQAAPRYAGAADRMRDAIERELWDAECGRYLRSVVLGGRSKGGRRPDPYPTNLPSAPSRDATVDIALLGLAWPYAVVDPAGERMRATVTAIEQRLLLPDGGVRRYEDDVYAGGNPWILAALWLGLWYRQAGDEAGHARCLDYALARQSPLGLLPEQAGSDTRPAWVLPLTWSHAMLVLAVRPEIAASRAVRDQHHVAPVAPIRAQ